MRIRCLTPDCPSHKEGFDWDESGWIKLGWKVAKPDEIKDSDVIEVVVKCPTDYTKVIVLFKWTKAKTPMVFPKTETCYPR